MKTFNSLKKLFFSLSDWSGFPLTEKDKQECDRKKIIENIISCLPTLNREDINVSFDKNLLITINNDQATDMNIRTIEATVDFLAKNALKGRYTKVVCQQNSPELPSQMAAAIPSSSAKPKAPS